MKILLLLILAGYSSTGLTIELRPYSSHEITIANWNTYYEEIASQFVNTRKIDNTAHTQTFTKDSGTQLIVITFTSKEHKAHPAWVTEVMTVSNNQLHTRVIGYYAGDMQAFKSFYKSIKSQSEAMENHLSQ